MEVDIIFDVIVIEHGAKKREARASSWCKTQSVAPRFKTGSTKSRMGYT